MPRPRFVSGDPGSFFISFGVDEFGKFSGTGNIGPFTDIDEVILGFIDYDLVQTTYHKLGRDNRNLSGRNGLKGFTYGPDVLRSSTATPSRDIE